MKKLTLVLVLNYFVSSLGAQKTPIDFDAIEKWPTLEKTGMAAISNDGHFVMYVKQMNNSSQITLTSVNENWKLSFSNALWKGFTRDSKNAVFQLPGDSLCLVTLGTQKKSYVTNVLQCEIINGRDTDWLAILYHNNSKGLQLKNLISQEELNFPGLESIIMVKDDKLILRTSDYTGKSVIKLLYLSDKKLVKLSDETKIDQYTFDHSGEQLAFTIGQKIWYYKRGMKEAVKLEDGKLPEQTLEMERLLTFSRDGHYLFISLLKKSPPLRNSDSTVKVDIWNYKDSKLQSEQLSDLEHQGQQSYLGMISIDSTEITKNQAIHQITGEGDEPLSNLEELSSDHILIAHRKGGDQLESWWNSAAMPEIMLTSLKEGKREVLRKSDTCYAELYYFLSPDGKYVVYFDNLGGKKATLQWYSYEVATGMRRCLTKNISVPFNLQPDNGNMPLFHYRPYGIIGWVSKNNTALITDQYDIWQIDPRGARAPINLTEGYGRKYHIKFDLLSGIESEDRKLNDTVLLSAFSQTNKYSGYFEIVLGRQRLSKLILGPYNYGELIKAKDAREYIFLRQTASDAPNWFLTDDWNTNRRLTDFQPERAYNWLTSELVSWKTLDDRLGQGILYKPEKFDSSKKYPVIVYYYEQNSERLYEFVEPGYTGDAIDIPSMVSNGYLVFVPDIYYIIGEAGESAYDYVVSGAKYISRLPYVDGKHMGLQGHSFGGYQTDYIITHSHLFKAAVSSSGWPDLIGRYGALLLNGISGNFTCEVHRSRIGATLWQRPDLYINNSPIFQADKVTTPLLMMNNKLDNQVPFSQGIEFFTALRRLRKPVWMLQYDYEGHSLKVKRNRMDYMIRMTQFFDYYLKGSLPPKWMTQGVPAERKGIDSGLELDQSDQQP